MQAGRGAAPAAAGRGLRDNPRGLDVVQLLEFRPQVGVTLSLEAVLPGAGGRAAAVAAVQGIHNIHSLDDLAEGGEALAVELLVLVRVIDEELGGPGVRPA